jgi:hypothetical protein
MAIAPHVRDTILKQLGPAHAHAYPKIVEQNYPHVLEKIAGLSGPAEMDRFFDDLLLTQRSDRKGFSTEAFGEMLTLINIYRKVGLLRAPPKKDGDVWNWIGDIGATERSPGNA